MARHPEVSEQSIIQAGKEIEATGKTPNPGAIRAQLGYRGSLIRIKLIWETFSRQREQKLMPEPTSDLCFDALPESYAENAGELMKKLNVALEQLTIEAYIHSSRIFDKRLQNLEKSQDQKLQKFIEAEGAADESIHRLEEEASQLQEELTRLADQNAKILLENAELRGRLAVFDERFNQPGETSV